MKFCLVTCESLRNYNTNVVNEDELLFDFLKEKNIDIEFEIWSNKSVRWESYDYLLIKSPWDYFDRYSEFLTWLKMLDKLQVKVLNSTSIIKWNSDKIYLQEMGDKGVKIIPTMWLNKGDYFDTRACMKSLGTDVVVFKPRVGGGAKNTFIIDKYSSSEKIMACNYLLRTENYMVQPFMEEIQTQGEWSFVYFNGKFSHSLLKSAAANDFRVQHYHGGKIHSLPPPQNLLNQANQIIENFGKDCLYARVDGIEKNNELWLMELELIEPMLFLFTHDESFENYRKALMEITMQQIIS
jgi:glutathione synthase/RimK-type ligase-like ATP-grasp enzyme